MVIALMELVVHNLNQSINPEKEGIGGSQFAQNVNKMQHKQPRNYKQTFASKPDTRISEIYNL